MSIQDLRDKIKGSGPLISNMLPVSIIIILVAFGSFMLGRISAENGTEGEEVAIVNSEGGAPASLTAYASYPSSSDRTADGRSSSGTASSAQGVYVASKNGKLYYTKGCTAANRLSEKTKIWFDTKEAAEHAGYKAAASCNK
jgi:hypothetical protein